MHTRKMNLQEKPFLSFEFASSTGEIIPKTFHNPLKLIIAHTIEEVLPELSTYSGCYSRWILRCWISIVRESAAVT